MRSSLSNIASGGRRDLSPIFEEEETIHQVNGLQRYNYEKPRESAAEPNKLGKPKSTTLSFNIEMDYFLTNLKGQIEHLDSA